MKHNQGEEVLSISQAMSVCIAASLLLRCQRLPTDPHLTLSGSKYAQVQYIQDGKLGPARVQLWISCMILNLINCVHVHCKKDVWGHGYAPKWSASIMLTFYCWFDILPVLFPCFLCCLMCLFLQTTLTTGWETWVKVLAVAFWAESTKVEMSKAQIWANCSP